MSVLAWWLLPIVTTICAVAWAGWVRRTPRRRADEETVEAYARFRSVLARSAATDTVPECGAWAPGNSTPPRVV